MELHGIYERKQARLERKRRKRARAAAKAQANKQPSVAATPGCDEAPPKKRASPTAPALPEAAKPVPQMADIAKTTVETPKQQTPKTPMNITETVRSVTPMGSDSLGLLVRRGDFSRSLSCAWICVLKHDLTHLFKR